MNWFRSKKHLLLSSLICFTLEQGMLEGQCIASNESTYNTALAYPSACSNNLIISNSFSLFSNNALLNTAVGTAGSPFRISGPSPITISGVGGSGTRNLLNIEITTSSSSAFVAVDSLVTFQNGTVSVASGVSNSSANLSFLGTNSYNSSGITNYTIGQNGAIQFNLAGTVAGGFTVTDSTSSIFVSSAQTITASGAISGSGGLNLTGPGNFTMTAIESYTGGTSISTGTLALAGVGNISSSSGVSLNGNSTFDIVNVIGGGTSVGDLITSSGSTVRLGTNDLTFGTENSTTVAGIIQGPGGIVKQGSGLVTFTGTNTFTGGTVVSIGTLALSSNGSLASQGAVTVNGNGILDVSDAFIAVTVGDLATTVGSELKLGAQSLNFGTTNSTSIAGTITGSGTLAKLGSGTSTISNANTAFSGPTLLSAGQITISNNTALGTGALTMQAGTTLSMVTGISVANNITLNGSASLDVSSVLPGTATLSGIIEGNGSLTKTGAYILALSGANTYIGGTTINAGTLSLVSSGSLNSAGTLTVNGGAFDISGSSVGIVTIGNLTTASGSNVNLGANQLIFGGSVSTTIAGSISGVGGSIVKTGLGTTTLTGANIFSGGTTVSAGTLALSGVGSLLATAAVQVEGTSTFDISGLSGPTTIGDLSTLTGTTVSLGANYLTFGTVDDTTIAGSVTGTGGIIKRGSGLVTLTGASSYTGGTSINAGTLAVGAGGSLYSLGAVNVYGSAVFDISASSGLTIGDLTTTLASNVFLGPSVLTFGTTNSTTISGTIEGTGSLLKQGTGTVTLSNNNIFQGGVDLSQGQIAITANEALGTGVLTMSTGTTLSLGALVDAANAITLDGAVTIDVSSGAPATLSGNIGNGSVIGSFTKSGTNPLLLSGVNTYTGGTTINGGTLALTLGGALAATGTVTVNGSSVFDISAITGTTSTVGALITAQPSTLNLGEKTLVFGNSSNTTIAGTVIGLGGVLEKNGTGRVTISNANTFTDGVLLNAGEILVTSNTALGSGVLNMAAGSTLSIGNLVTVANNITLDGSVTIDASSGGPGTIAGIISGSGSITKAGPNFLRLSGANTYENGTTVAEGTLALVGSGSLYSSGTVTLNAGSFDISALTASNTTIGDLSAALGTIVNLGVNTLTFGSGNNTTIGASIQGAGSLLKKGNGTATFTGVSTFTGGLTVNGGTAALSGSGSFSPTGPVTVNVGAFDISGLSSSAGTIGDFNSSAGTTLNLGSSSLTFGTANNSMIAGAIVGVDGSLVKNGTGMVTLSNANNSFSGGVSLNAGKLFLAANNALGSGTLSMADGTILSIGSGVSASNPLTLNGLSTIDVSSGGKGTLSGIISGIGSLLKTGADSLIISNANTYIGGTTINGGILALLGSGSLNSLGAVTLNVGVFDVSGVSPSATITIGDLATSLGTTVNLGATPFIFGTANNTTIAGAITGSGTLTKQGVGDVTLSYANTDFTGPVSLNAGTIFINNNMALGTNILNMADGTTLSIGPGISAPNDIILNGVDVIDVSQGGIGALIGNITGTGSLRKTGGDVLALSGANAFTAGTIIQDGTLALVSGGSLLSTGAVTLEGLSAFDISAINAAGTQIGSLATALGATVALGNKSLTFGDSNNTTVAGPITGTGSGASLVKVGTGTASLSNANAFIGGISLNEGQITILNDAALGQGRLNMASNSILSIGQGISAANNITLLGNAFVDVSMGGTGSLLGNISGNNGSLTKIGPNVLSLLGHNNYASGTTISGGTLALVSGGSLSNSGAVTLSSGTFDISAIDAQSTQIGDLTSSIGTIVALGPKTLIFGADNSTFVAGTISGDGGAIEKLGSGEVTFAAVNSFTGGTTVNSGAIFLSGLGSFASTGAVTLNDSAKFDISGITAVDTTVGDLTTSSQSVISLGSKQLIFGGSNDTALLGSIVGLGSLAKNGSATVEILNANTFSGGMFLNDGQLVVGQSGALGSGVFTTADGTAFTLADGVVLSNNVDLFSGNTDIIVKADEKAYITGLSEGSGGVSKLGSGTLIWEGNGVYSGTSFVNNGTLQITEGASIQASIGVAADAVLQSCGNVGGLDVYGEVIPGCSGSSATAYVNGSVIMRGGSYLSMNIGNQNNSTVVVYGDVIIEDGAVVNFTLTPDYNRLNNVVTFLYSHALSGHFDPARILINSPLIQPIISQSGGNLSVGLNVANFTQKIVNNNNAVAVGQAIYNLAVAGDPIAGSLISSLIGLGEMGDIVTALNEMHPALYKGLTLSQENNAVRVQDTIGYRFQQQLNQVHCTEYHSSKEDSEETKVNDLQRIQKQLKKKIKGCEKVQEHTINLWVDGFGDVLGQSAIRFAGSPQLGYQVHSGGVSLGIDGNFAKYFYLGAMGAYTGSSLNWHDSASKATIDAGFAGLYFSGISDMFYGNLSVIGGWSHYSGHRSISYPGVNQTANNGHHGSQILSHADTGVNLGYKGFTFRPFDSFDYIAQSEGSFTENGAGIYNLNVQNTSAIMLRNELGMQFAGCLCFSSSRWTIAPKFSWVLESRTKGKGYVVEFEGTDLTFDITGYFPNRSLFSPGLLISGLMLQDRLSVDLYYNAAFGEKYSENNYGGQIRYGF